MTMTVNGNISDYHDLLNEKLQQLVQMIARTRQVYKAIPNFFYGDMTSSYFDAMSHNLCAMIEMVSSPNLANLFLFTERTSW